MFTFENYGIEEIKKEIINHMMNKTNLSKDDLEFCIEISRNQKKSDFALQLVKIVKEKEEELKKIQINNDDLLFDVSKTGFQYNFKINKKFFSNKIVQSILNSTIFDYSKNTTECKYYGAVDVGKKETVCIEHSSPNIAKKFHAGHLRTSIIGNCLVQIYKFLNFDVIRINHLGDWGKQYGLLGVGYKKYGNDNELIRDPIKHLLNVYIKINQDVKKEVEQFKKEKVIDTNEKEYERLEKYTKTDKEAKLFFEALEKGNTEYIIQWKKFRDLSLQKYTELYSILNIEFDDQLGESFYALDGLDDCIKDATLTDNGDYIYELGILGNFVVKKSNGSTLYSTRDIAAIEYRTKTYKPIKIIYVVSSEQELHFKKLFAVVNGEYGMKRRIPENLELIHVNFGKINGLSTRKGNLVFLEDIIDEAREIMHDTMKNNPEKYQKIEDINKTTTTLAISAMVIQDLSAKRVKNYDFDMKRCTSYEGHTGPYLQYTHCRLVSIKNKNIGLNPNFNPDLLSDEALNLIFYLSKFSMAIIELYNTFEPCKLVTYLMSLSKQVNSLFSTLRVYGQEKELAEARLAVFECARIILCNGIKLLGLIPLERM